MPFERRQLRHLKRSSAFHALKNAHEFRDLPPLLGAITGEDCILDAMGDMVAQEFFLHAAKGSADSACVTMSMQRAMFNLRQPSPPPHRLPRPNAALSTR
jgi:hypothetical protein